MSKRKADDLQASMLHQDSGSGIRSRSGRVVKPKVYEDGTVAQLSSRDDRTLRGEDACNSDDGSVGSFGSPRQLAHPRVSFAKRLYDNVRQIQNPRALPMSGKAPSKPTTVANPTAGGAPGGVFKQAALEILRQEGRLMSTGEIARLALKRGLVRCSGKTPEATMASALYTDVKRREENSTFIRPSEGLFGLREWTNGGDLAPSEAKYGNNNEGAAAVQNGGRPAGVGGLRLLSHVKDAVAIEEQVTADEAKAEEAVDDGIALPAEVFGDRRLMHLLAAVEVMYDPCPEASEEGPVSIVAASAGAVKEDGQHCQEAMRVCCVAKKSTMEEGDAMGVKPPVQTVEPSQMELIRSEIERIGDIEKQQGRLHPAVGVLYLALARTCLSAHATCAPEVYATLENAISKASDVMAACNAAAGGWAKPNHPGGGLLHANDLVAAQKAAPELDLGNAAMATTPVCSFAESLSKATITPSPANAQPGSDIKASGKSPWLKPKQAPAPAFAASFGPSLVTV